MRGILAAAIVAATFVPAVAQSTTPDGRPINPAGITDSSGRPIDPAGISDSSGRPIDPAGIRGHYINPADDPFGTRRDLAGRPIRPDGITSPKEVASVPAPTDAECKLGWTAASPHDQAAFAKLCAGHN